MRKKNKLNTRQPKAAAPHKTKDSFQNALARLGAFMPSLLEGTEYPLTRLSRDFNLLNSLYRSHWIVRRIIDVIPEDMCKNWIALKSQLAPKALKEYRACEKKTNTIKNILLGLKWGRLYGGALGVMLVAGQGDDLSEPLDIDAILPGDYKGLLILDRWNGCAPSMELVDDISSPDFGTPLYYQIDAPALKVSARVHCSRVLKFPGAPLPYWETMAEAEWDASEIEVVYDELKKRDNVSWNIAQLTFMANLRIMKIADIEQVLSSADARFKEDLYNVISAQNAMMSNSGIQILGKDDDFLTHQYTFGGIAQVYEQFIMDISGAAGIPATRLFGRSPSGMDATGAADLKHYYEMIETKQTAQLEPIIDKLMPVMAQSVWGYMPDDLEYVFNPLERTDPKSKAEIAGKRSEMVFSAYNAGLISKKTGLKELQEMAEETGMWTNITSEDIERADDFAELPGEAGGFDMAELFKARDADFDESEHPRDAGGKFTAGTGELTEAAQNLIGKEYKGYTGQAAIKKLLQEQNGHIKNAFTREDIGGIDLVWGDDTAGLQHIIKQRSEQGFSKEKLEDLLFNLEDVISSGTILKNTKGTFEIFKQGKVAIVSPELRGNHLTFLLTAYKSRSKK